MRLERGGAGGDWPQRIIRHHIPLAVASAAILAIFVTIPLFDANVYPHADLSGAFAQARQRAESTAAPGPRGTSTTSPAHGAGQTTQPGHAVGAPAQPSHAPIQTAAPHNPAPTASVPGPTTRSLTVVTGYLATALLGVTLLIGPANLVLRRRNPVSSYLRRDVGTWTAIFSVVHVFFGLQVHARLSEFVTYFVAANGSPLLNSFGLGNWTGLAGLAIVVGLLALSSDAALRTLRAKRWKWLQRLNYVLFALVIVHAFFYGALERIGSPYTTLLLLSVLAVFGGQVVGVLLYRARHSMSGTWGRLRASEERMRSLIGGIALVAASLVLGPVAAASCAPPASVAENADRAVAVVYGTVTTAGDGRLTLRVERVLKGSVASPLVLFVGPGRGGGSGTAVATSVDYTATVGTDHVLYLVRGGDGQLETNACIGSHAGQPTADEVAFFGAGTTPLVGTAAPGTEGAPTTAIDPTWVALITILVGASAAVALGVRAGVRSRSG